MPQPIAKLLAWGAAIGLILAGAGVFWAAWPVGHEGLDTGRLVVLSIAFIAIVVGVFTLFLLATSRWTPDPVALAARRAELRAFHEAREAERIAAARIALGNQGFGSAADLAAMNRQLNERCQTLADTYPEYRTRLMTAIYARGPDDPDGLRATLNGIIGGLDPKERVARSIKARPRWPFRR